MAGRSFGDRKAFATGRAAIREGSRECFKGAAVKAALITVLPLE